MSGKMDGTSYHYVVDRGIYYDTSTKGRMNHRHHSYRAEVRADGLRIRKRFASHSAARAWIDYMCGQDSDGVRLCLRQRSTCFGKESDADRLCRHQRSTRGRHIDWSRDFALPAEMCK